LNFVTGGDDTAYSAEALSKGTCEICSRSLQGEFAPFQFLKPYLMYFATNVASVTLDFVKGNIEDSVADSPSSQGAIKTPVCSPLLL
jgi:hypothetical protein